MTSGMCVLPGQRGGQPFLTARPADGFAGAKIDDMRAAAQGVEAGPGAGQGVLEAPEAGEVEVFREAQHEADDGFDVTVLVVMDPEGAALGRVLEHEIKACDLRVVCVLICGAEFLEQRKRAGSLVGG